MSRNVRWSQGICSNKTKYLVELRTSHKLGFSEEVAEEESIIDTLHGRLLERTTTPRESTLQIVQMTDPALRYQLHFRETYFLSNPPFRRGRNSFLTTAELVGIRQRPTSGHSKCF